MSSTALFPAYAGVIPHVQPKEQTGLSFPRMCGGDPNMAQVEPAFIIFSPHVRGLREGVTGSAAADAFLSAADPLRAGPLDAGWAERFLSFR